MKTLNPDAAEWVPGGAGGFFAAAPAGGCGSRAAVLQPASCGAARAPPAAPPPLLTVLAPPPQRGASEDGGGLPTPNGLAELATVLSTAASADMTFEDLMFDNSSRRGSLVGQLEEVDEEQEEEEDEGQQQQQQAHAPAAPAHPAAAPAAAAAGAESDGGGSDASARTPTAAAAAAAGAGSGSGADSPSAGAPPSRSCPVPIAQQQRAADASEAAAVAKAQRDLLADAPNLQSAASTDAGQPKLGPQDFEILRVVGQGAFGKVFQVRARATGRVYAMKVMRKERILQKDHSDYVRAERDLLTAVVHPYIVTLRYSFQTASKLYLVLDFINGGHLFFNLYRQGVFGEDVARLYTAEIVAALTYLHGRGIVHRDLKPENVLLDVDGHIRITDFGLAKANMSGDSRTNSFIGTMEYMAPEIIEGSGHGCAVDWWSTGVLLYEMLAGVPPFRAKSRAALQQQITGSKPKFPKFLSSNALSLLKALLTRDPAQRLGSGPAGSGAVKAHPFFKGISWAKLEARQLESSFKPGVKCNLSVENFDKIWTEQHPVDSPCGTPTDPAAADAFAGFTYVAPSFAASTLAGLAAMQQQQQQQAAAQ